MNFKHRSKSFLFRLKELFDPSKPHLAVYIWLRQPKFPSQSQRQRSVRPSPLVRTPLHYAALSPYDSSHSNRMCNPLATDLLNLPNANPSAFHYNLVPMHHTSQADDMTLFHFPPAGPSSAPTSTELLPSRLSNLMYHTIHSE